MIVKACSSDRLGTFTEYFQVGIVHIEFFTLASGGFLGDAEFDEVIYGIGDGRLAYAQLLCRPGNREGHALLQYVIDAER